MPNKPKPPATQLPAPAVNSLAFTIRNLAPGGQYHFSANNWAEKSGDGKTIRFVRRTLTAKGTDYETYHTERV